MSEYEDIDPSALGPNMWLVDEMYRRYRENPEAVDERWREFFEDFRPRLGDADAATTGMVAEAVREVAKAGASKGPEKAPSPADGPSQAPAAPTKPIPEGAERIRFGAERVVKNMQASLEVPTATSFRFIPAKLLEENRRVINRFLSAGGGRKASCTSCAERSSTSGWPWTWRRRTARTASWSPTSRPPTTWTSPSSGRLTK